MGYVTLRAANVEIQFAMTGFTFNPQLFRALLRSSVSDHMDAITAPEESGHGPAELVAAMEQAIDVMERADADRKAAPGKPVLSENEISEIGDYAMELLEALVELAGQPEGDASRELMRLAVPVAVWTARHGGRIRRLELTVNSLAAFANELKQPHQLEELADIMREIIEAADESIARDLEQTNPMRPWRVIHLNYGIIATRSHNTRLIEQAYDLLVKNLPRDAREFFREGMRQMDRIGYPQEVREVVERYDRMWGADSTLH